MKCGRRCLDESENHFKSDNDRDEEICLEVQCWSRKLLFVITIRLGLSNDVSVVIIFESDVLVPSINVVMLKRILQRFAKLKNVDS